MRRLSGLILGFGLVLIVFCLSLGLVNADWTINQAKGYMNTTDRIAIGYFEPAPNANLDVANWSRMQGIRVHTLIVDGNVGIGTVSPSGALHINSSLATGSLIVQNTTGSIHFFINGTTGNVGIGARNPLFRLHVVAPGGFGSEDANGIAQTGNVPIVAQSDSTAIGILNSNGRPVFALNIEGNEGTKTARGYPVFYDRYNGSWNPSITLKNGNVGIGTTNPREKLHVDGTIRIEGWDAVLHSVDTAGRYQDLIGTYQGWNPNTVYIAGYNAVNSGRNTTAVSIGGYGSERLWVNLTSGNVGIGTTNPGAKLHLSSLGSTNDGIIIDNPDWGQSKARIFFREGGSASYGGIVGYDAGADILYLNTLENTVEKQGIAIARSTGNVGIGTTSPGAKLDVNGSAFIRGDIYGLLKTFTVRIECNGECNGNLPPSDICKKWKSNSVAIGIACKKFNGGKVSDTGSNTTNGCTGDMDDQCAFDFIDKIGFGYYCSDTDGWDAIVICAYY